MSVGRSAAHIMPKSPVIKNWLYRRSYLKAPTELNFWDSGNLPRWRRHELLRDYQHPKNGSLAKCVEFPERINIDHSEVGCC
jgi:hypothetical protein